MPHQLRPDDITLQPGEYCVAEAGTRVRTLLGSCVSITLWHPRHRVGAMCHFLLASRGGGGAAELDARFADEALALMLLALRERGIAGTDCEAKLFGGGKMFPHQERHNQFGVGQRNGDTARRLLGDLGIPIVSESLYGIGYRQIVFDIDTGHVWARQVQPAEPPAL